MITYSNTVRLRVGNKGEDDERPPYIINMVTPSNLKDKRAIVFFLCYFFSHKLVLCTDIMRLHYHDCITKAYPHMPFGAFLWILIFHLHKPFI